MGRVSKTWLLVACVAMSACSESTFSLSTDSRLPHWFRLPIGVSRGEVTVTLSYDFGFTKTATLRLRHRTKGVLTTITANVRDSEPQSLEPNTSRAGYPMYEVLTANSIEEVIEHRRMESIFYITITQKCAAS
jgi:hypothetical protein